MQIVGITKPIKTVRLTYRDPNSWRSASRDYIIQECDGLYGINETDVIELTSTPRKFKPEQFGVLTDSATLYFDKSATFPRYKLEGTEYKRCIKVEKADFIIVDKSIKPRQTYSNYHVFEDKDYVYISDAYQSSYLNQAFNNSGIHPTSLYSGVIQVYSQKEQILLTTPPKPLISDEDLNKKIDTTISPEMTLDDAKQIITMLNSADMSVVDLGLKLLAGFSVSATPFSIKTILLTNKKWLSTNARNSVGVKSLLNSLGVDRYQAESRFPWNIGHLNDGKTYSEKDLKMGRSLLRLSIENYVNNALSREIEIFEGPNVGFKVNISVEEK